MMVRPEIEARRTLGLWACAALALYLPSLPWLARWGDWPRLLLPNLWLLAVALLLWRRGAPWPSQLLRGLAATRTMLVLCAGAGALLLAFALAWPRGALSCDPACLAQNALLVTLVPLAEELFFRGLLLAWARQRWGPWPAALAVSLLFGLLHLPQGLLIPMTLLSLALCSLTLRARSAIWAVALHACWNGLAALRQLAPGPDRWPLCALTLLFVGALALAGWQGAGKRTRKTK